jgi:hypothetical protein
MIERLSIVRKLVFTILAITFLAIGISSDIAAVSPSSWDQTVQLSIPLREKILDFTVENPAGGDGSEPDPYTTYSSNITLRLTANGPGEIIVTDNYGNVIYTYNKTSSGTETITFPGALRNGVGLYELTAQFVDPNNLNTVYDSKNIFISYLPTTVIPSNPGTGVFYLGDRAFLVRDIFLAASLATIIIAFVAIIIKKY